MWIQRKRSVVAKCRRLFIHRVYIQWSLIKSLFFFINFRHYRTFSFCFLVFFFHAKRSIVSIICSHSPIIIGRYIGWCRGAKWIECNDQEIDFFGGTYKKTTEDTDISLDLPKVYVIYKSTSERASSTLSTGRLLLIESKHRKNRRRRNDISERRTVRSFVQSVSSTAWFSLRIPFLFSERLSEWFD